MAYFKKAVHNMSFAHKTMMDEIQNLKEDFVTKQRRIDDEFARFLWYQVLDLLDYYNQYYPFKNFDKFRDITLEQMTLVLYRRRDFNNRFVRMLVEEANLDWFAEPYFARRGVRFSDVMGEYDAYRVDNSVGVSSDCCFVFNMDVNQSNTSNSKFKRNREQNEFSDESEE